MKRYYYLISLAFGVLISSCLEEITLKGQQFKTQAVVIQGKLVKGSPASVEVTVRRIGDFNGFESDVHISGSIIKLLHQDGVSINLVENFSDQIYRAMIPENHPIFQVQTGVSYRVSAILPDGRHYESDWETLLAVPKIEEINYKKIQQTRLLEDNFIETADYIQYSINTNLINTENNKPRLRWEVSSVYRLTDDSLKICYLREPIENYEVLLYNTEAFQLEYLDTFILGAVRFNYRFAEGYYLTVIQESLSKTSFIYWDNVKKIINRTGNMFDPQAGQIEGNWRNLENPDEEVFGFFYATEQDTMRLFIRPEELNSPRTLCPIEFPKDGYELCDNCLGVNGSTLQKPDFWIE